MAHGYMEGHRPALCIPEIPQNHQNQTPLTLSLSPHGGNRVTWAKSTEATRLSCRGFGVWSQDRARSLNGDISLKMAAQRTWSCSGLVGKQRVVCNRSTHIFSSLRGETYVTYTGTPGELADAQGSTESCPLTSGGTWWLRL